MYGHYYSSATISNISKATQENVAAFHERSLEANYYVLFLDGTYLPLRREIVSKECIHIDRTWHDTRRTEGCSWI